MKAKILVFAGPERSGKTAKALEIFNSLNRASNDKCVFLNGRGLNLNNNHFFFSECTLNTEVVIIDDVDKAFNWHMLAAMQNCLQVNRRGQLPFRINPMFIITTCFKPDWLLGASWDRRMKIFDFPMKNEMEVYCEM